MSRRKDRYTPEQNEFIDSVIDEFQLLKKLILFENFNQLPKIKESFLKTVHNYAEYGEIGVESVALVFAEHKEPTTCSAILTLIFKDSPQTLQRSLVLTVIKKTSHSS